jgi:hypothetical protein
MKSVFNLLCDGSSGESALCGAGGCASREGVLSLSIEQLVAEGGRYAGNGEGYASVTVLGSRSRTGVGVAPISPWHTA